MADIDYLHLDPEFRRRLEEIEARSPKTRQLVALDTLNRSILLIMDSLKSLSDQTDRNHVQIAETAVAISQSIKALDKEQPELPDYSKPIVKALKELDISFTRQLKKVDVRPEVKAPDVHVTAPEVNLRGVEQEVKKLEKAFKEAIKLVPQPDITVPETDLTGVEERLGEMLTWLESIDTASRMKPQFPDTLKVTNTDGSTIGGEALYTSKVTTSGADTYIGEALPGTAEASAAWRIQKVDTNGSVTWKDGNTNFDNTATDLTVGSFS